MNCLVVMGARFILEGRWRSEKEENLFTQRTSVSHPPEAGRRAVSKILLRVEGNGLCCDEHKTAYITAARVCVSGYDLHR